MTTILDLAKSGAARLVVAGLLAVVLAGCGKESPEKLMASAKEYIAKGDRKAAVIELRNVLKVSPDNGEARLLLGQALFEADDFPGAEKELGRALELKQSPDAALPPYLRALLAQNKSQAVIDAADRYRLASPAAVASTQTSVGEAQTRLGNRPRARAAFAEALAAVPGYPRARLGEAQLLAIEKRADEALKLADEVVGAEPKLAEAQVFRAALLLAKGDRGGGKKALEDAVAANERFLPARLALIELLIAERDVDGAVKLVEGGRKQAPDNLQLAYFDALLAFQKGDAEKARKQVQGVLKHAPEFVPALVLAGSIELKEGQLSAAEVNLSKAVGRAPNHLGARQLLVRTYLRSGQPVKAKETLQPLVERGLPASPALQLLAGETYLANGDVARAEEFFKAATKAQGAEQAAARTRLGQIALATGRSEEGFTELEAASGLDAESYQADLALIAGHLRRKEFDKAMEAVKALEKKQPNNPLTFQMYGLVHLAKRDAPAARRNFDKALELQPSYLPAAYNLGMLDVADKRPEDARKRYEAMIAREPKNEQLYLALADLQARTGAEPKAIGETLQRAVDANPQAVQPRLALVEFHLRNQDTKAALTAAQSAVAAMPNDARILQASGAALEAAGEINQAIETYNKLATLQPQSPAPLLRLAALHMRQKDTGKAIDVLRRAQKLAPNARDLVPPLVQVYLAANRPDEALKEARGLQKSDPKFAGGYALEGDVHAAQRKFAQAEPPYRQALKLEPRAEAVAIRLHRTLADGGKAADAEAFAKGWLAENPKSLAMRLYLGERELATKNYKAAAVHYQAAIAIDGNNAIALNNLAWIGGELGDPKALGYAERAVKLAPNNAAVLDTYGTLLVKQGETAKGLEQMNRAATLAPGRHDIRLNYAKALAGGGKKAEARKELEALQALPEDFPGKSDIAAMLKSL